MPDRSNMTYTTPDTLPTDPVLADLVPEFIEQWMTDLTVNWADLRTRGDLEEFRRFGHTIKGSFLQFGFAELSRVGKEVMHDAETGDWEGAEARLNGIVRVLTELRDKINDGTISL